MTPRTYYIDFTHGSESNDGLVPERPFRSHVGRVFEPGDEVLFRRGGVFRGTLQAASGREGAPVTYGAYGVGPPPLFLGSVSLGDPQLWKPCGLSVWVFQGVVPSEPCNLILDDSECGRFRFGLEDLREDGEWYSPVAGAQAAGSTGAPAGSDPNEEMIYLHASDNPAKIWPGIECALWGERRLVTARQDVVIRDLAFRGSGVHGFQASRPQRVELRNCDFRFIGGAMWNRDRRIRFGNAIELWDGGSDCLVEGCHFDNIYDAGVTHQGGGTKHIPERLHFRNNTFSGCGLASYECREPSRDIYFENNRCLYAGGGFSMQGEAPPRQSELYPRPVGHHVFIWRIEPNTQAGPVYIRHNEFLEAPYGAAIYSVVDPADERWFHFDHNRYTQTTGELLARLGGRDYRPDAFDRYREDSGQDAHSTLDTVGGHTESRHKAGPYDSP